MDSPPSVGIHSNSEDAFDRAVKLAVWLASNCWDRQLPKETLAELALALYALPIETRFFAMQMCRVDNALALANRGEFHAAGYELRLVARALMSYRAGI